MCRMILPATPPSTSEHGARVSYFGVRKIAQSAFAQYRLNASTVIEFGAFWPRAILTGVELGASGVLYMTAFLTSPGSVDAK